MFNPIDMLKGFFGGGMSSKPLMPMVAGGAPMIAGGSPLIAGGKGGLQEMIMQAMLGKMVGGGASDPSAAPGATEMNQTRSPITALPFGVSNYSDMIGRAMRR